MHLIAKGIPYAIKKAARFDHLGTPYQHKNPTLIFSIPSKIAGK